MLQRTHELAATERCLREDLDIPLRRAQLPLAELREDHPVIRDFLEKRAGAPEGQEPIRDLLPKIVAFSMHTDHYRSATWFQRGLGVVWLLASGVHREGQRTDSYKRFVRLRDGGQLLPVERDVRRVLTAFQRDFVEGLRADAIPLTEAAKASPGSVLEGILGGRIRVRVAWEDGLFTVAISQRVMPGTLELPADWLIQAGAAFFPDRAAEAPTFGGDVGGLPLRPDEAVFCDFL